jgi:hypothetical protein
MMVFVDDASVQEQGCDQEPEETDIFRFHDSLILSSQRDTNSEPTVSVGADHSFCDGQGKKPGKNCKMQARPRQEGSGR